MKNKKYIFAMFLTIAAVVGFGISGKTYVENPKNSISQSEPLQPDAKEVDAVNLPTDRAIADTWYFHLSESGTLTIRLLNSQTSGGLTKNYNSASAWDEVWSKNGENIRPYVKKIVFVENEHGYKFDFGGHDISYMFSGFNNLVEIDFSGVKEGGSYVRNVRGLFQNCSKLKSVDLSWMMSDSETFDMVDMFNGCSILDTVILNNPGFVTRESTLDGSETPTSGGVQMQRMFQGCSNLKYVDMSNITIYGRSGNSDWKQVQEMFKDQQSLEEVRFENTQFPNVTDFTSMFENCTSLKKATFTNTNGGSMAPNAVYMTNMFKDCTSLDTLDLSGFGELDWIVNMDGLVANCTSLKMLNLDNLDNSHIGPTSYYSWHYFGEDNSRTDNNITSQTGCYEYGRDLGLKTCTSLETLSARNSNIWMCKNNRGLPGSEYFDASSESNIYYFTEKQMNLQSDADPEVLIATKRNYVDLITDRDGKLENMPTFDGPEDIADRGTNINIVNGDLNQNGPGRLPAGVYTISDNDWEEQEIPMDESFYRIAYLQERPYQITGGTGTNKLVIVDFNNDNGLSTHVNTVSQEWPTSGNYEIDLTSDPLVFTYENAAIDVNGKLHNVSIALNKIKFKNLEKIPARNQNLYHDNNHYYNDYNSYNGENAYYRPILRATQGDGLLLLNYARKGDPNNGSLYSDENHYNILTGGSGMEIDFTVTIDGANPNSTFIFNSNDLDIPATQEWYNHPNDQCFDKLTIDKVTYGLGGESFILGEGNHLNTIRFAENTGLTVVDGNKVVTTGSDPSTSWSEFAVKADATGANYTWVSGVGCTTYALRDTKPLTIGSIALNTAAQKDFDRELEAGQFQFQLEADGNQPTTVEGLSQTKTNDASGKVVFDPIVLEKDANNNGIDNPGLYYPGTNPTKNTHGEGQHNQFTYTFKIKEVVDASNSDILYDNAEHTVTVKVRGPENDEELEKGIMAEFFLDDSETAFDTVWSKVEKTVNLATFVNRWNKTALCGRKVWNDKNNQDNKRPGSITVRLRADDQEIEEKTVTADNGWSWEFNDLPKYNDNAVEIVYTLTEDEIAEYETAYETRAAATETAPDTIVVTNTHIPDSVLVSVSKIWDDHNNNDHYRPAAITLHLTADDEVVATREVTGTGYEWEVSFGKWPRKKEGQDIAYSVREDAVNKYETSEVVRIPSGDEGLCHLLITNTHKLDSIRPRVSKQWTAELGINADVEFRLYRTLRADIPFDPHSEDWTLLESGSVMAAPAYPSVFYFKQYPKFHNGIAYRYHVQEASHFNGFEPVYEQNGELNESNEYTEHITNTKVNPISVTIPVKKVLEGRAWNNSDTYMMALLPQNGPAPDNAVTIDDITFGTTTITNGSDGSGNYRTADFEPITFTLEDMEGKSDSVFHYHVRELTAAESGLPRVPGVSYSTELYHVDVRVTKANQALNVDGITVTKRGATTPVDTAVITNHFNNLVTHFILKAEKELTTNGLHKTLADGDYSFTLKPIGENAAIAPMPSNATGTGADRRLTVHNEGHLVLFDDPEDQGFVFSYYDLLYNLHFTNEQLEQGVSFRYEIGEDIPDGCELNTTTFTRDRSVVNADGVMIDETYDAVKHIRTITVRKTTVDGETLLEVSAGLSLENDFCLTDNGDTVKVVNGSEEYIRRHGTGGVPVFHNSLTAHINVTVEKRWDDFHDALETRPNGVTVTLLANGAATGFTHTLTADENWTYTFQNLPVSNASGIVNYTVRENVVNHYTADYSGDMDEGLIITNTLATYGNDEQCAIIVTRDQLCECTEADCPATFTADGNTYTAAKIDGYCWMTENLRTEVPHAMTYRSSVSTDAEANAQTYGYLYTWHVAAGGTDTPQRINGYVRGICPNGWHLPTTAEINVLRTHSAESLSSEDLWVNQFGTNASGFNARPAGFYNATLDRFEALHSETWFHGDTSSSAFGLQYHCCTVPFDKQSQQNAFSVRCVKDCE